jgi:hypothetical protein
MIPLESRRERKKEEELKQRKNKKDRRPSAKQLPQFTTGLRRFDRQPDIVIVQGSLLFPFSFFCCISPSPLFCKVNSG